MPPKAVKTIRDLIFWEYAKLISGSALGDRKNFGFIMSSFKKLQLGEMKWSQVLREDLHMDPTKCIYCGATADLSNDHIVAKRECHFAEIHNIVKACKKCNSSKGDKDLMEWWGLEKRYEIPRDVMGKYLKMLYLCHECRGTLGAADINKDARLDLLDLGAIFLTPCNSEKARLKDAA